MGTMPHAAFTCCKGANLLLGQALMQSVARSKLYLNSFNSRKITIFRNLRIIVIPGAKSTKTKFGSPPKYVWKAFSINPLWGHCQEYKIEKNAIPQEGLLSEKKKHFCILQPYLVWKLLSHWSRKTNPKVRGTLKGLPKIVSKRSHQEEYLPSIAPKPHSVFLPALHLKLSRSLTNFQPSPARHSPPRSKDRRPNHAVVWNAAGVERWQTVHSQLSKPDTKTRTAYNSTVGRADEGKRNFRGSKRQLFLQNEGLFKASTASIVSQLHAREKWRLYSNHNYQKTRLESPSDWSRFWVFGAIWR